MIHTGTTGLLKKYLLYICGLYADSYYAQCRARRAVRTWSTSSAAHTPQNAMGRARDDETGVTVPTEPGDGLAQYGAQDHDTWVAGQQIIASMCDAPVHRARPCARRQARAQRRAPMHAPMDIRYSSWTIADAIGCAGASHFIRRRPRPKSRPAPSTHTSTVRARFSRAA